MNPIVSLYQALRNPNQFIQNMMNNNRVTGNPMAMNALDMMRDGNSKGIEKMARNVCKQRGINPDEAVQQIRQQLGI